MIRKNQEEAGYLTYGQLNLITSSRFNWVLLAVWTREYIHSVVDGLDNVKEMGNRLYRVPVDFYNLVLPFIGRINADRLLNLTSLRIITMMNLVNAMKNNDTEAVNANTVRLYQIADELANFVAEINPYWSHAIWQNLFYQNIRMNIDLITSYMSGNHELDIAV